jgi:putative hydrolase of the HAD superfamily
MAETVLFDLFGVIAHHQSPEGRNRLLETAALSRTATGAFWDTYWRLRPRYDQGLIHGSEYWTQVASALDIVFDDRQIADLTAADIASWSAVDETMVALLGELAASGHRLALLSNIPEELAAHYEIHHSWLEMFQVRGFSCRIGHAKPDPAAFRWCLDALAVPADQVVFVDDRGENIRAAQTIGIRCHLFTTPHASANSSPLEPSNFAVPPAD